MAKADCPPPLLDLRGRLSDSYPLIGLTLNFFKQTRDGAHVDASLVVQAFLDATSSSSLHGPDRRNREGQYLQSVPRSCQKCLEARPSLPSPPAFLPPGRGGVG